MNRFSRHALWVFALSLVLSACSVLPDRPPSPALHDFGLGERASSGHAEAAPWMGVTVDAPEWLQSENIRYRLLYSEPTRVRFYSQDRWIAPPPALLAQRLSLCGGGKGHGLKINVLEFEQVFDGPRQARMILAFRALAYRPGEEAAIAEKLFRFARSTPSADAQGAVTAAHGLVEEAAKSLEGWLAGLPAGQ